MSQPPVGDLYASLTYNDAQSAIEFLCQAFGFSKKLIVPGPDASIMHSELILGSAVIMVSSPKSERKQISPLGLPGVSQAICLRVDDPDSHYATAKAAGATIVDELKDEDFGSRGYMATDFEGHLWYFGTYRPGKHWES